MDWTGKRVFITGGAAGLGRALAAALTARGARVCIGDVNATGMDAVVAAGEAALAAPCDVTREDGHDAALAAMTAAWGGVDMVILNAGVAQMGPIERTTLDDWRWITEINLFGVVRGIRAVLPLFRAQGGGHVVTVASMAGWLYLPDASAYNATKAAVVALSETLMLELEKDRIAVQVVCPSFFRTSLAQNMRASDNRSAAMTTRMVERARMGADEIAVRIIAGIERGDPHILTHPEARKAWILKRLLPFRRYMARMRADLARIEARLSRKGKA